MEVAKRVSIRPIVVKNPRVKKGDEIMIQSKSIRALVDGKTGKHQTGLSEEDVKDLKSKGFNGDLSPDNTLPEPHPFWDSERGKVRLEPKIMFLDLSSPINRVHYGICLDSPFVANSEEEYQNGDFPKATHIIFDENKDAEAAATKIILIKTARKLAEKLSPEKQLQVLMVVDGEDYTNKSASYLVIGIENLVNKKTEAFLEAVKSKGDYLTIKATVLRAISQNILKTKGLQIQYREQSLGTNVEAVVKRLMMPSNQEIFLSIQESFK